MDVIKKNIKDILNSTGKGKNFMNDQKYSDEYKEVAKKWSKLPMYTNNKKILEFFNLVHKNQIIMVVSGTGSGKTVLVPKFLLKYFESINKKKEKVMIGITNPKIITTENNAIYSAKTLDVKMGEHVGFSHSNAPNNSYSKETKLLYITDGLLSATILSGDKYLTQYNGIIIDEAHERQINIDLLLGLLKEILLHRPEFKLIIMSATIDTKIFKEYFTRDKIKYGEIEVAGVPNFPIANNWLDPSIIVNDKNYVEKSVELCFKILDKSDTGDIIIFVPGVNDALKGCKLLKEQCPKKLIIKKETCSSIFCVEVFAQMENKNRDLAINKDLYKSEGFKRKVIFATNVAESSITFDGLVYVIDTGLEFHNYYDPEMNGSIIKRQFTSQAQIKQRIGRTGRTTNGIAYYLYSEKQFKHFRQYPLPGILLADLTDVILSMINYAKTVKNVIKILKNLITPPNIKQVINAIYKLFFLDAIKLIDNKDKHYDINHINHDKIKKWEDFDNMNGSITTVGIYMLRFKQTPIMSSYGIIASKFMNCSLEIMTITAIIDSVDGQIYKLFKYKNEDLNKVKEYFSKSIVPNSDHLTLLNIYNDFYSKNKVQYLNVDLFHSISKQIQNLQNTFDKIDDEKFESIKEKYIKITIKPFKDNLDNVYYILGLSHYFNLLNFNKNEYTPVHSIIETIGQGEFLKFVDVKNPSHNAIFYELSNAFGKKSFKCITHIPANIIKIISGP